ncbi:MAG: D-2-hydroxyacid dehydrogenase [Cyclobacteriaceae bacterium]
MYKRILTSGRLSSEFCDFVKNEYPDFSIVRAESKDEILSLLPTADVLAGFNFLKGEDISHIKWIHAFGAGVDSYLKIPSLKQETTITRTTGALGSKMGEFCLSQILAEIKSLFPIYENQKRSIWKQIPTANLFDQEVLILGTGSIGSGIAKRLNGQVKKIIGLNRSQRPVESFDEIRTWVSLGDLSNIDVVIGALPSTSETSSVLGDDFFKKLNNVIFINVGRGDSVDEEALVKGIESGRVRRAILDVFAVEPLPKNSPLWSNESVTISPHQSGLTTIEDVGSSFQRSYEAIKNGKRNELFINTEKEY